MITPKANKALGQHYLKDKSVIQKIIQDQPREYDYIVEVGPGPASLTKYLNELNKPIYLIEMDNRFQESLVNLQNVKEIFFEDALKFSFKDFSKKNPGSIWLVSNLPYNISSQLFILFTQQETIKYMTLMYQKEVGEKTIFKNQQKNQMGSLLSIAANYFKTHMICKVLPGAFNPPPKVDSIVISYQRIEKPLVPLNEFKKYESFLRLIFSQKRKQIKSLLKSYPKFKEQLISQNIDLTQRAESLNLETIQSLYKTWIQSL